MVGAIVLVILLLFGGLVLRKNAASPQAGELHIKLSQGTVPGRAMVTIENRGGSSLLIWQPCRVERKETGRIIADATRIEPVLVRGTNSAGAGRRTRLVFVQLPGTNQGPWRLLVPVSRYEMIARGEARFGQPVGTWIKKFPLLMSLLHHSQILVASEWFDNDLAIDTEYFALALHPFQRTFGRWPTNVAEATAYLRSGEQAITDRGLKLSDSFLQVLAERQLEYSTSTFAGSQQWRREELDTIMFILRNFRARRERWPANISEVKTFTQDPANFQPEFPPLYEIYSNAVFTTQSDGGFRISHPSGGVKLEVPR